jgi:hypothetical protein
MNKNSRITNSTIMERKHKSEYMKAGKKEVSFGKLVRNTKVDAFECDTKTGFIIYGSKSLQEEAYVTAPALVKANQELEQHQEANRNNPEYQVLKAEKKAQRKLLRSKK